MRTGAELFYHSVSRMTTGAATTAAKATFSPPATIQRSPWHSPVPYLFGGLAAMLGLIAFALLVLACSYWNLSGNNGDSQDGEEGDVEAGEKGDGGNGEKAMPVFEEKFLVIMAGEVNPTFLATPVLSSSKVVCVGDGEKIGSEEKDSENEDKKKDETDETQLSREGSH